MRYGYAPDRRQHGFTLIELLVVIAIIAILAAILFPVFARARDKANTTACLSNMKQLGTGLTMYTDDTEGRLPGNKNSLAGSNLPLGFMDPNADRNWARGVFPYVKTLDIYYCPTSRPRQQLPGGGGNDGLSTSNVSGAGNTSYLLNGVASDKVISRIKDPAGTIYLQEMLSRSRSAQVRPVHVSGDPTGRLYTAVNHYFYSNVHNQGGNLLFCDGHARYQRKTSIAYAEFGFPPELNARKTQRYLFIGSPDNIQQGQDEQWFSAF